MGALLVLAVGPRAALAEEERPPLSRRDGEREERPRGVLPRREPRNQQQERQDRRRPDAVRRRRKPGESQQDQRQRRARGG